MEASLGQHKVKRTNLSWPVDLLLPHATRFLHRRRVNACCYERTILQRPLGWDETRKGTRPVVERPITAATSDHETSA
jgi:hypothetical protein